MKKLLLTLVSMLMSFWLIGQTITIGTGTSTGRYPLCDYYVYSRSQMLFLASELTTGGNITHLRWYRNDVGANAAAIGTTEIWLMETSSTTLSGTAWEGPGTLVASISNIDLGAGGGWYEVDITDFVYSGSSNLLVSVRTQNAPYTAPHSFWRYTSTSANYRMRVGGSDSSNPPTMSLSYLRPNIQFEIVTEACSGTPDPGNTISSSSSVCSGVNFTLSLQNTTPGSGVTYQWQSSLTGAEPWTNMGTSATQVTSQTEAKYYRCEVTCAGNTGTSNPLQVAMNLASVPYEEGFITTATPACWTTTGWFIGSTRGVTGNPGNNIYKNIYSLTTSGSLFTSGDIGPVVSGMVLTFDYIVANYNSPYSPPATGSGNFVISVSSNGGTSYDVLETVNNNGVAGWQTKLYPLTSYSGNYIKIKIQGNWVSGDWDMAFDNFKVEMPPVCIAPTTQTVSNKTDVGADLSWVSTDSFFDIFIQGTATPAPDALTTPTADNVSGNTYTWAGGSPATPYYWWVRTDCDEGGGSGVSTWTGPNTFTTLLCNPVNQCNYTFNMIDSYGDGWNGATMQVKQNGTVVATLSLPDGLSGSQTVALCDGVGFEVLWNAGGSYATECGLQILNSFGDELYNQAPIGSGLVGTVLYTGTVNCTPPACPNPTAQNVSAINTTGATLNWTHVDSFFDIFIVENGQPGPGPTTNPSYNNVGKPFVWSDGSDGILYDWYVRADCEAGGGTGQSDWVGPNTFGTSCLAISAFPYIEDFSAGVVPPACWSEIISNSSYNWKYNSSNGGFADVEYDPALADQDEWLITPEFDFSGLTHPRLTFDWLSSYYWFVDPNDNADFVCHISLDGGGTWTPIWDEEDEGVFTNYVWYTKRMDLTLYAGEPSVKFAFQYVGYDAAQSGIDNFKISEVLAATWTGAVSNVWTLTGNWNPDVPGANTNIIIPGGPTNYPTLTSAASCNNFTIQSGGSFIGSEFLTINGTTTIERSITGYTTDTDGWHLISSPVINQPISGDWTPAGGYDFYALDESKTLEYWLNQKNHPEMTNFIPGKGYLVAYDDGGIKTFTGPMNMEAVTLSGLTNTPASSYPGWHLVGNPFTSAINAALLTGTNMGTAVQVWNSGAASYEVSTTVPALNGFMIETTGSGELTIPLTSRTHSSVSWFKSTEDQILLRANDPAGHTSQLSIVRFNPEATEAYDRAFDSHYLAGFAPMFYSKSAGEGFALNTLPQLTNETVIPFEFIKNGSTDFNIELVQAMPGAIIYLTDKKTNTVTNLLDSPVYSFNSVEGDITDRFLLTFASVGIDNPNISQIDIYGYQDVIFVKGARASSEVVVTNLLGQVMISTAINGDGVNTVNARNLSDGIYLVSVISGNSVVSKKVVLQK